MQCFGAVFLLAKKLFHYHFVGHIGGHEVVDDRSFGSLFSSSPMLIRTPKVNSPAVWQSKAVDGVNFGIRQSRLALDVRTSMRTLRRQTLIQILIEDRARTSTVARCWSVALNKKIIHRSVSYQNRYTKAKELGIRPRMIPINFIFSGSLVCKPSNQTESDTGQGRNGKNHAKKTRRILETARGSSAVYRRSISSYIRPVRCRSPGRADSLSLPGVAPGQHDCHSCRLHGRHELLTVSEARALTLHMLKVISSSIQEELCWPAPCTQVVVLSRGNWGCLPFPSMALSSTSSATDNAHGNMPLLPELDWAEKQTPSKLPISCPGSHCILTVFETFNAVRD